MSQKINNLFGLVLAGGKSMRMGRDKAELTYSDKPQFQVCYELLARHCEKAFLSTRADQAREGFPQIYDAFENIGPMGGILSAFKAHPNVAWLVVACDLPYLDDATVSFLIEHRNSQKMATVFVSSGDGLPEPLCAIYEPASYKALLGFLEQNIQCPRKALIRSDIETLTLPNPRALDNVNKPKEYEAAKQAFHKVEVHYHAMLREASGRSTEMLETKAQTAADLYRDLSQQHGFLLPHNKLKVAINNQITTWDSSLKAGDVVVFIPPTAGG